MTHLALTDEMEGKVLLIRIDRIGDLILTLPVDTHRSVEVTGAFWWVPESCDFLMKKLKTPRKYATISHSPGLRYFFQLYKALRCHPPKAAVVFHAPWWVSLLLWLARVPIRIGRTSQWHSYVFFNHGLRQRRSLGERHESRYNWELLDQGFEVDRAELYPIEFNVCSLKELGQLNRSEPYTVVHPGMGGSAENWPTENYVNLILRLALKTQVVVTGTKMDLGYLLPIEAKVSKAPNVHWFVEKLSGEELIDLLGNASAVVAPSTGVLHLAATTGVKTIGLFSRGKPSESAKRWGPLGKNVVVLEANPGHGGDSVKDSSMSSLDPDQVVDVLGV